MTTLDVKPLTSESARSNPWKITTAILAIVSLGLALVLATTAWLLGDPDVIRPGWYPCHAPLHFPY